MPKKKYKAIVLDLNIDEIRKATVGILDDAMYEGADVVYKLTQVKVPVATGRLKRSGYIANSKRSTYTREGKVNKAEVTPDEGDALVAYSAPHSHLLEYGSWWRPAKPYLRPSLDEKKEEATEAIAEHIRKGLRPWWRFF